MSTSTTNTSPPTTNPTADQSDATDRIETADGGLFVSIQRILSLLARPELAKWRPTMAMAVILTLIAAVLEVISPLLIGNAINAVANVDSGEATMMSAVLFLGLGVGIRFTAAGLPQIRDMMFSPVSQHAQRVACVDAFGHAQSLSLNFHQTRRTGALNRVIERGASAIDYLIRFLAFNIGPTMVRLVLAAVALGVAFDYRLSLIAVAAVAAYVVATVLITEWRVRQRRRMNIADTNWRAISVDTLTNFETVKAFAAERRETDRYNDAMAEYNDRYVDAMRSMYLLNFVQALIMNIGLFGVLALSAWNFVQGSMEIGDLTAVMLMLLSLYAPLNILGWAWREIKQGAVDLEKLYGLLQMKADVADRPGAIALSSAKGHVAFESVSFKHDARAVGIDEISFDLPSGKTLALVGTSGAGKSTVLKLLFRFYDVQEGRVLVDGKDVKDLTQESLRKSLGLVPQDVVLFNDTIRANIAYANPDASMGELRAAAAQAQILDFIESQPEGWDTRVGERGLKLSGGEKQRVGIARVILADPAILVLDEATSALDSTTEAAVQNALDNASRGRTTVLVAHRLSTVQGADEILVLNAGRIVERGTHEELLAKEGEYADMWSKQAKRDALALAAE